MKFLIDTNILIPAEPTSPSDIEPLTAAIVEFVRLVMAGSHHIYVHPASMVEITKDRDPDRRVMRQLLAGKYETLPTSPQISSRVQNLIGEAKLNSHNYVDNLLIAALDADAIDFLVTEDRLLRRKAERIGLGSRLVSVVEALSTLRGLFDATPTPPPAVFETPAYELNERDPIFDSLRKDYTGFDEWLRKCKLAHRVSWIIKSRPANYAGVCIVKHEESNYFLKGKKTLKLCTFKVAEQHQGYKFGELLLKTIFEYSRVNCYDELFVTVFPKHTGLLVLFEAFGFSPIEEKTKLGELIYIKPMKSDNSKCEFLNALEFNIKYGPYAIKVEGTPAFVIPILPQYHRILFPDAEKQSQFFNGMNSFGNGIRKAYLCHANIRKITQGSILLFYKSHEGRRVFCVGVAEDTLVSAVPNEIARFVGRRTVYDFSEIERLCRTQVLAIQFRQSRILRNPITFEELRINHALTGSPQSIVTLPDKARTWLHARIDK